MALEISDIVRVTAQIRPQGVLRAELGKTLFLTTDDTVLSPGGAGKVRTYSRFADLADDFASDSTPYQAAVVYFQQVPFPRNLVVGRWLQTTVNSRLLGATPASLASLMAVSDGSFRLRGADFIGLNLSAPNSFAAMASALQTKLRSGSGEEASLTAAMSGGAITSITITDGGSGYQFPPEITITGSGGGSGALATAVLSGGVITGVTITNGGSGYSGTLTVTVGPGGRVLFPTATVTYSVSPSRFVVDFGGVTDSGGALSAHSLGTGTDVSALFGLDSGSGAEYQVGGEPETVQEALDNIAEVDSSFYFVTIEPQFHDTQTVLDVSAWVGARENMFSAESNSPDVLTANETGSIAAQLSALRSGRTWMTWSDTRDYKALSIAARFSSVNFASPGSLITGKFKSLPGTTPDSVTATQKQELDRKRLNHFSPYGTDAIYAEGWTFNPGTWIDVRYWLDWIVGAIRTDVYNLLRSSPRVPQTLEGVGIIHNVIEGVCRQGVRNGGIAAGVVSAGMAADIRQSTRNPAFAGNLSTGYLVYVSPISEQSQTEREARMSPPFRVWLKGSGAVHFADIALTFEN